MPVAEGSHVAYQRALALLGATDVALIDDAVEALAAGDAAALFGAVESVIDAGHDPRRFATDLLERFRDLIVLQAVPDAATRGVVDAPEDELEKMRAQAGRMGTATLTRYAEVVHAGLGEMRGATAPRLLLEVVCARLLLPSASDTESALLQRVERIETRLDMSIPAAQGADGPVATQAAAKQFVRKTQQPPATEQAPAKAPAPPPAPDAGRTNRPRHRPPPSRHRARTPPPVPPRTPAAATPGASGAGQPMPPPCAACGRRCGRRCGAPPPTEVMLDGAIGRAVEGDTLVLSHPSAPLAKRLNEQRNVEIIREALKDALGVNWQVRCEVGARRRRRPRAGPGTRGAAADRQVARERARRREHAGGGGRGTLGGRPRRDPEEVALELLQNELGARKDQRLAVFA